MLTVVNSTFSGNFTSGSSGGAIYNAYNPLGDTVTVTNSTLSGNSATYGGGIYNDGMLTITNSTLSNNSASSAGGGIYSGGTLNYANTIIANSPAGGDCANGGTIGTHTNNLVEDTSCSASLGGDPSLAAALNYNGGQTQTLALLAGSTAINAGNDATCAAAPVNNLDQRAALRPNGLHCDIGSYEADSPPNVTSSTLVNPNPTNRLSVNFTVTFSEAVTGVDTADFNLTTTGVTGASITGVSGSGAARTVSVNTGTSNGTIRLNVIDNDSILDTASNPLGGNGAGNGNFTTGLVYTVNKIITLSSTSTQDGWILESSETSNAGGVLNSIATTFNLGDDATKKQYRGILSFSTGPGLPDTAHITAVTLKVKRSAVVGGGNPVTTFQGFMVDVKKGLFGTTALQAGDFQAAATKLYGPFNTALVGGWYSINLATPDAYINKLSTNSGLTQIRLRFKLDDNNNTIANYLSLFSGNAPATSRPQLVITYYVP
jgi:predicted outer membrane repeat protein